MALSPLSANPIISSLVEMRQRMDELQGKLATGRKSETFGGLGPERTLSVAFRQQAAAVSAYQQTNQMVSLRLRMMDSTLTRMEAIPGEAKAGFDPAALDVQEDGRTSAQKAAGVSLDEVLYLLNAEVDGRYLFAGNQTREKPVAESKPILDGAGGKAGFRTVLAQRKLADLGANVGTAADPLHLGRTVIGSDPASNVVTFAEDGYGHPFGFKIAPASSNLTGATVVHDPGAAPATPASLSVTFSGPPRGGETIQFTVGLPDGTEATFGIEARAIGDTDAFGFTIGTTDEETAANFAEALKLRVGELAATDLSAASAMRAGTDFFDTSAGRQPQRVDGPPFETATSLRDGGTDTVSWYTGQNDGDPRSSVSARIDGAVTANYGTFANEEGFRTLVSALAVMTVETFPDESPRSRERYSELASRARFALSFGGTQSVEEIHSEIASAGVAIGRADERHTTSAGVLKEFTEDLERVSLEEVAAQLMTLNTRLQASYEATTMLYQMSLVNYVK